MSRLFIGRVPPDATEKDLDKVFGEFGELSDVHLKTGYAFVEYRDERDAEIAAKKADGAELLGSRLVVEFAKGRKMRRRSGSPRGGRSRSRSRGRRPKARSTQWRLLIENLAPRTSWQDLKDYFRREGEVTYTEVSRDRDSEGLVDFATRDDMLSALDKLNGTELNGSKIRLSEDKSRSNGDSYNGGGGYGGRRSRSPPRRGRSRSRSRSRGY